MPHFESYEDLVEFAETQSDEHAQFKRVTAPRSGRQDLHAFILLDALVPGDRKILAGASHDEVYLDTDTEQLAAVITPEQVVELIRCSIRFGSEGLCMFA